MSSKNFFGRREELAEILEKLKTEKKSRKESFQPTPLEQPFTEVPEVGHVTLSKLYIDEIVRCAAKRLGIFVLGGMKDGEDVHYSNRVESMILAKELNLELLTNKDYWRCVKWALENNKDFADNLKMVTWTNTLVLFSKEGKLINYANSSDKITTKIISNKNESVTIGESDNLYSFVNSCPALIENCDIVYNEAHPAEHRIEGGVIIEDVQLDKAVNKIEFDILEKKAGLPWRLNATTQDREVYFFMFDTSSLKVISCGYNGTHYFIDTRKDISTNVLFQGFFCKKKRDKNGN